MRTKRSNRIFSPWVRSLILHFAFLAVVLAPITAAQARSKYAAVVLDANSGKILFSRNADASRYPASLTKMMTLYILFEYLNAGRLTNKTKFYVTPNAAAQPPSKLGLKAGQYIKISDLIGALVTKSANDAAVVVAENLAGKHDSFARVMTKKARLLGMHKTTFKNASGLPNRRQKTTARDMLILSERLMQDFPRYAGYFRKRYFGFKGRRYRNHNSLLFNFKGTQGIKTGYTRSSGFNLTVSVKRGQKHLIAVVMGGRSAGRRDRHMRNLLTKYFPKASRYKINRTAPAAVANRNLPKRRKPVVAKQRTAAAPAAPAAARPAIEQGDRTPATVSAASVKFLPKFPYVVQVGAFSSKNEAIRRVKQARSQAPAVLDEHTGYTIRYVKDGKTWFRARFANFTRSAAIQTCEKIRKPTLPCAPMRAN